MEEKRPRGRSLKRWTHSEQPELFKGVTILSSKGKIEKKGIKIKTSINTLVGRLNFKYH